MTDHFVRIASIGDLASARVVAARLESEGIEVRLHGEGMGPYPMTVGQLAVVEVWVLQSRVDQTERLLMEMDLESVLRPAEAPTPIGLADLKRRVFALLTAIVMVWVIVWTAMRVF